MREILFRGKRKDNGQWIEGALFDGVHSTIIFPSVVETESADLYRMAGTEVDPKTVGQFTGLTDESGKKIFEGDIICGSAENCKVVWDSKYATYILIDESGWNCGMLYHMANYSAIVGNIYDNPELMEATK